MILSVKKVIMDIPHHYELQATKLVIHHIYHPWSIPGHCTLSCLLFGALPFHLIGDKLFVRLQRSLDVDLEFDDIVQHLLQLGV